MDKRKEQLKKLQLEIKLEHATSVRWLVAGSIGLLALIIALVVLRGV